MPTVQHLQKPKTATLSYSIWANVLEDQFRTDLVRLEKQTNAVPVAPQTFSLDEWQQARAVDGPGLVYILPCSVEKQLADDFAFLTAIGEGARSVSAVSIEERVAGDGLTVRIAAVDATLDDGVRAGLEKVVSLMVSDVSVAEGREPLELSSSAVGQLFDTIVQLHYCKILGRLRSCHWKKPKYLARTHKKPLWQDFANLIHRVQFLYPKNEATTRKQVETALASLQSVYHDLEEAHHDTEQSMLPNLSSLINASFLLCLNSSVKDYASRLAHLTTLSQPTKQVASALKTLRQIEKIGAYQRIAISLLHTVRRYPILFQNGIKLDFLPGYESIPTSIHYEPWAKTCHVHPEIQLIAFYDLQRASRSGDLEFAQECSPYMMPRVIGSSKYYCYLCYLFIRAHGHFFPANTHGRLYDQWTIPDLAEYSNETLRRYRHIITTVHEEITEQIRDKGDGGDVCRWREEPMTSRQDLLSCNWDNSCGM